MNEWSKAPPDSDAVLVWDGQSGCYRLLVCSMSGKVSCDSLEPY